MEILLLTSARPGEPAAVLPALDLLPHSVRTAPRDVRTLVAGPSPDVVLIDARSELADARATSRMLHATGLGVPLVAVVSRSLTTTGAEVLTIPLARGGARLLYHSPGGPETAFPPAVHRSVLADLSLPLERNRLVALVQHVDERARITGRSDDPSSRTAAPG